MKLPILKNLYIIMLVLIITSVLLGCSTTFMHESIKDKHAGMNGSFEIVRKRLPVNWMLYTPKTVQSADFDIIIDTADYKDGKQSLKFVVRKCNAVGGRFSPGFKNENDAKPGELYNVSFWAKHNGGEFYILVGGVSKVKGEFATVVYSKETIETWQYFEYKIPSGLWLFRHDKSSAGYRSFFARTISIGKTFS